VFPSLALITQFKTDYCDCFKHVLNISSESITATTDKDVIQTFIMQEETKLILVTYQSLSVLIECLDGNTENILALYDEAHHVVSPEYQKSIFRMAAFEKEVFLTATPRDANNINMTDGACGPLAFEYTYLQDRIKTKRKIIVADLGCGRAPIAHHFKHDPRFTIHNYDHQTGGDSIITKADISNVPLEEDSVEFAILCLALIGTNQDEYICEAHRILESNGVLYISESTHRSSEEGLCDGVLLEHKLNANGFTVTFKKIDKFCMFICSKNRQ